jgi:CDP-diacylglycerol---glycerol-3-phosphate 3-phosphatidyltransferase
MATSFGPSALATPANAITAARVAATPVLVAMVIDGGASWLAFAVWVILAGSDGLDGYVARRHGATRSGAFLDPLADKVLVLSAMVALVANGLLWWVPVVLIACREVAISAYRSVMARRGVSIPARPSAKAKTLVQSIAVGLALLPPVSDDGVAGAVLWVAVVLTLVSGAQYFLDGRHAANHAVHEHR